MADEKKILKWAEIGGGGFLSGMGFSKPVAEPVEEEKKSEVPEESSATVSTELLTEKFGESRPPARVISRESDSRPSSGGGGAGRGRSRSAPPKRWDAPQAKKDFKKKKKSAPVEKMPKREKVAKTSGTLVKKSEITIGESVSVKEFSEKMGVPLGELLKKFLENKIMINVNSTVDFDTALLIASEFEVEVKSEQKNLEIEQVASGDFQAILDLDKESETKKSRPAIVTVMGHVDHGKTSLLDYFRKSSVAAGEAGGITQSIGASVIERGDEKITFIDTPGHELFTNLRARGAKITNIVVLVVAADDGIMPQTRESIDHAKAAWVPLIVAVTKIDKAPNNLEKIKGELAQFDLTPEDWGGDVPILGVSSVTGQGMDDLLDSIALQAEMLELQYDPARSAIGVVLDAHKDAKEGIVASLIVMTGTLEQGDIVVAQNTAGKIRRMQDRTRKITKKVGGGEPARMLGFSELPDVWFLFEVVKNEKDAQKKLSAFRELAADDEKGSSLDQFLADLKNQGKTELRLVLRADGTSSLEALRDAVLAVPVPENVTIKIVSSDVGHFSDSDVSLGQASKAILLGFNVRASAGIKKKAQNFQVDVKSFDIIYELTDFLGDLTQGMIERKYEDVEIGRLEILGVFFRRAKEMVVGGKVTKWLAKNGAKFQVWRGGEKIATGEVTSLQKDQENVKEIAEGHECGMKVRVSQKIELGDELVFLEAQEVLGWKTEASS